MTQTQFYKLVVRVLRQLQIPFVDPCDPNYTGDCSVCTEEGPSVAELSQNAIGYGDSSNLLTGDATKLFFDPVNEYFSIGPRNGATFFRAGGFEVTNAQNWYSGGTRRAAEISVIASDSTSGLPNIANDNVTFASMESVAYTAGNNVVAKVTAYPYEYTGNFSSNFAGSAGFQFRGDPELRNFADKVAFYIDVTGQSSLIFTDNSNPNHTGFEINFDDDNIFFPWHDSTRDDTGTTTPVNFLYTNASGRLLSAPIASLGGGGGGSTTFFGLTDTPASATATGRVLIEQAGNTVISTTPGSLSVTDPTNSDASETLQTVLDNLFGAASGIFDSSNQNGTVQVTTAQFSGGGLRFNSSGGTGTRTQLWASATTLALGSVTELNAGLGFEDGVRSGFVGVSNGGTIELNSDAVARVQGSSAAELASSGAVARLDSGSFTVEGVGMECDSIPQFASTAAASGQPSGTIFSVSNGDGTAQLHIVE